MSVCVVWLSLVKLPATTFRDSIPQSWEAVLSFGAAHHLQWGKDIVFTYGPLAFLTNDFYWGSLFLPTLLWSFAFATIMTTIVLHFARRLPLFLRVVACVALLLLTTPLSMDLGFDPIYFLSITLLGIVCLPDEQPSVSRAIFAGVIFGVLTLVKFTFALYCVFALLVLLAAGYLAGNGRTSLALVAAYMGSLLTASWFTGQSFSSILLHFARSFQLAAAYSSGMTLPAAFTDLVPGVASLLCLGVLIVVFWCRSKTYLRETSRVLLIAAGAFLAWKEGFVRPDTHVIVFLVYSFLLAAFLPALLAFLPEATPTESSAVVRTPGDALNRWISQKMLRWKDRYNFLWTQLTNIRSRLCSLPASSSGALPRSMNLLLAAALIVAIAPFGMQRRDFATAIRTGLVPRMCETVTALVAPPIFKKRLEGQMESMRKLVDLPRIRAAVSGARVGVLSYDQQAAILNGLNYAPHPVFQSYAAYTPALQQLNANFFQSEKAPDYVLWRPDTVDAHFPTLEDGAVFLDMLSAYSPVVQEQGFTLWKRVQSRSEPYQLSSQLEINAQLNQWIALGNEPTWLRVELRRTLLGSLQNLLWNSSEVRIEVAFDQGQTERYRLTAGNARAGFLINPFFPTEIDPAVIVSGLASPRPIKAFRIYTLNKQFFKPTIRVMEQQIHGIAALRSSSVTSQNANISQRDR